MKIKYFLLATISGAVVALDQVTKLYIHTRFELHQSQTVILDYFDITYVRNYGAAFGFMSTAPIAIREPLFALIPLVALAIIIWILRGTQDDQRVQVISLSLIFGGAVGNYIDRLRFSFVIDFLDFHYKEVYHWPAFNVADAAIVIGVSIMIAQMLFYPNSETNNRKATT